MSAVSFGANTALVRAFEAAGHTAAARITRAGTAKVSLDGAPETALGPAYRRMEAVMTAERSWPWMRPEAGR